LDSVESPEPIAWKKILAWAEIKGLLLDPDVVRFFGFNNPNPSPESPKYGYEQWITVGPEDEAKGGVEIKEFPGGFYAVGRCKGISSIGETWKQLGRWLEGGTHKPGKHQWLEESLIKPKSAAELETLSLEDIRLDLYLPLAG
jgi:DNA gyrase inhibitor GyrI